MYVVDRSSRLYNTAVVVKASACSAEEFGALQPTCKVRSVVRASHNTIKHNNQLNQAGTAEDVIHARTAAATRITRRSVHTTSRNVHTRVHSLGPPSHRGSMSICMIYPFTFAAEVAASVTFRHYWETKIEPVFAVKLRAEELQSALSGMSHLSLTLFVRESKHYLIIMLYTPRERGAYMFHSTLDGPLTSIHFLLDTENAFCSCTSLGSSIGC